MPRKDYQGSKNFNIVAYQEHFNNTEIFHNYIEYLFPQIPHVISPLHNHDVFDSDEEVLDKEGKVIYSHKKGDTKKPHYHAIICFSSSRSLSKIRELFLNCMVQITASLPGSTRYLCHLDDSDKYLYDEQDVMSYHGFDYEKQKAKGVSDEDKLNMLCAIALNNDIKSLPALIAFLFNSMELNYLLQFLSKKTFFMKEFFNSLALDEEKRPHL